MTESKYGKYIVSDLKASGQTDFSFFSCYGWYMGNVDAGIKIEKNNKAEPRSRKERQENQKIKICLPRRTLRKTKNPKN